MDDQTDVSGWLRGDRTAFGRGNEAASGQHGASQSDDTAWFTGSKVVREDGSPLVVYRGEPGADPDRDLFANTRKAALIFTSVREAAAACAGRHVDHRGRALSQTIAAFNLSIRMPLRLGETAGVELERFVEWQELILKLVDRGGITEHLLRAAVQGEVGSWRIPLGYTDTVDAATPGTKPLAFAEVFRLANSPTFLDIVKRAGHDGLFYRCVFHGDESARPNRRRDIGYDDRDFSVDQWHPFDESQVRRVKCSHNHDILSLTEYRERSPKLRNHRTP
jgi:hypothetical protein